MSAPPIPAPAALFSRTRLFEAWMLYRRQKRRSMAVAAFELRREEELAALWEDLAAGRYAHGPYRVFTVHDPKKRTITAASCRDRVVHQIVFDELERRFEPVFLDCSYSARRTRGVHLALDRVEAAIQGLRSGGTWPVWALKCDVRKFYDSVDHEILLRLVARRVDDPALMRLIEEIVRSYRSNRGPGKGIPLGNLTSQVFANIYLHELDRFAKHGLRLRHYFRYADDVLLLADAPGPLVAAEERLRVFLDESLALTLTPSIADRWPRTLSRGVDYLGSVLWPYGRTLRPVTRGRIVQRLRRGVPPVTNGSIMSYRGIAKRVRDRGLKEMLM